MNNRYRPIWILVLALCASAAALPTLHAAPLGKTVVSESSVTVPANGEATIAITAYCLNFGEPFPKAVKVGSAYANDNVIKVMKAAASDGTGTSNVLQTQIAIWNAIEGKWGYKDEDVDMTVAKALAASSANQTTAPLSATGTALDKAIADGLVEVTVDTWTQADAPKALPADAPYYGTGTLKIKNLTGNPVEVYVPLGLTLTASNAAEQDMGVYAVTSREVDDTPKALPKTGAGDNGLVLWMALAGLTAMLVGLASHRATASRSKA